jgi:hypothetical protein
MVHLLYYEVPEYDDRAAHPYVPEAVIAYDAATRQALENHRAVLRSTPIDRNLWTCCTIPTRRI